VIKVAALYIDPKGPYPAMEGVDAWGEDQDARNYAGPYPIIAHPPCGPWGRLRKFCTKQDPKLGPLAVEQIREWDGVLEHPAGSLLWDYMDLPKPGEPIHNGFWTIEVAQCRWGHRAEKKTWLLLSGIKPSDIPAIPPWQEPTACVDTRSKKPGRLIKMSSKERRVTPPAFAQFLFDIARKAAL